MAQIETEITVTLGLRWWVWPVTWAIMPFAGFMSDAAIDRFASWVARHGTWVK